MIEEGIIRQIIDAWAADQAHPYRHREQKPLPDIEETRVLLETAFLASMKREEGRPIKFSVTLLYKNHIKKGERSAQYKQKNVLTFSESIPFSADSITKIAPAFDFLSTSLLVGPKDKSNFEYEIWGAIFYNPPRNLFEEVQVAVWEYFPPDFLSVAAVSPGSLLIARGDSVIGRFLFGSFERSVPTPFLSKAMGKYFLDIIREHKAFKQCRNEYWGYYRETLNYLLNRVSYQGTGGTIILMPNRNKNQNYERFIDPKHTFEEDFNLEDLIVKVLSEETNDIAIRIAMNKKFAEKIDFFAQLSCIDGALIITNDLHLLSFGSTLTAPKWNGNILIGPDGFGGGGGNFNASKYGTRHNSAINFVGACPGSIAFVVSKDGPVRGLLQKDEGTILCWPDCLVSMFLREALESAR